MIPLKVVSKVLFFVTIILLSNMQLEANVKNIKLDKDEKRFKVLNTYTLKDFHFNWDITYMDIVNFDTENSNGIHFSLLSKVRFYTRLKVGKTLSFPQRKQLWLAKAILKKHYFWKEPLLPSSMYNFTSLRFLEKGDQHFKAITELKDIRDMFGEIDTEAELHVWIEATMHHAMGIYSYKKTAKGYRVRFASTSLGCQYSEYFNYYDKRGKLLKTKKLKSYRVKGCSIIYL